MQLYCGDCLDILPQLEPGSIDAVVTDPPYGIGFKYASHDDTPDGYGAWLWQRLLAAESSCTPGSPVFVWQAMLNIRKFHEWFPREFRLFASAKNFVQMRPTPMQYSYDPVIVWWTEGKAWSKGTNSRDFHISNTAGVISNPDNIERGHPCPRPVDAMLLVVDQWAREAGTVCDPFMGSGTTGVAAVQLGRRFIGIEIDPKYFEVARKRIEIEYRRGTPPMYLSERSSGNGINNKNRKSTGLGSMRGYPYLGSSKAVIKNNKTSNSKGD